MKPYTLMSFRLPSLMVLPFIFIACSDPEAVVYEIPKEKIVESSSAPAKAPDSMQDRQLDPALIGDNENPDWIVPSQWLVKEPTSVRRGNFTAGLSQEVEITVTTFPGDVGGLLANVNRWRGQVGLPPISEAELPQTTHPHTWNYVSGTEVHIDGPSQSTLAAVLLNEGNSWFIKMTGPTTSVSAETESFNAFMNSLRF